MSQTAQIEQAVQLINQTNNIVALTGAGISTASGIPDFRSPNSGLWEKEDPLMVASIYAFRQDPTKFYRWIHPLSGLFFRAKPNAAHLALAQLEEQGKLTAVITQNIDNLHTKAGSKTVYELHGHLRQVTCTQCYQVQDAAPIFEKFIEDGEVPLCPYCGGVLKPNAILFGEQLPMQEFVAAQMELEKADLLLVVGSSLEVAPASDLALVALDNGARIIIINHQPTYLDNKADVVIRDDIASVLPYITKMVDA
jgi:NAD-dependent deacetylase